MKAAHKMFLSLALLLPGVLAAQSTWGFPVRPLNSSGILSDAGSIPLGVIQHVVVIFQENRTPDNLFHHLRNADIADFGFNSQGKKIRLTPLKLANNYSVDHSHKAFEEMYHRGRMDGADKMRLVCNKHAKHCPPRNPAFKYVLHEDVLPYFRLAEQYTFGDRMFQTQQGPSFPAHQFIISGTSIPNVKSDLFASSNPLGTRNALNNTGCTAPKKEYVFLIGPNGRENHRHYPCFEHPTLPDLLDNAGVSWRYYTPLPNQMWTAPNAIFHLRFGPDWNNVVMPQTRILRDIARGDLPSVSWVIPTGQDSDHPGGNDGTGPSWVASIVNAIGKSQYWSNTAIFITWDDWGGWYDHVAPYIYNQFEYGFRVPLIVVSPYAKQKYVSHVTHDFGSILKFIEEAYGLPSLGYADARADDLFDCFNFKRRPATFHTIPAPYNANYFLNDKRPPTDPDDD